MQPSAIRIGSYTLARRGCELLREKNIPCRLRRCVEPAGSYGCVYTVEVSPDVRWRAESLLRESGIMVLP